MNDNQNNAAFQQGRSSSRVLNPPGGKTSFSLGTWVPPGTKSTDARVLLSTELLLHGMQANTWHAVPKAEPQNENGMVKVEVNQLEPSVVEQAPEETREPVVVEKKPTVQQQPQPVSANAFAAGSNMNGAQVMTGRPTSRVLHPGGGGGAVSWTLG